MAISAKHEHSHASIIRDIRPLWTRIGDAFQREEYAAALFILLGGGVLFIPSFFAFADVFLIFAILFWWWLATRDKRLMFKLPMDAPFEDKNNDGPGKNNEPEGILYLGNTEEDDGEIWFTNSDARTHVLYLGTTGAGKTVGLTSMVTNALSWGSGFVYIDGKADTDLWSALSALTRRFGRDDDLMVLNYMTGNASIQAPSNTMNPFSSGSPSYLTNMLVSLMPPSEGDNAMWKERAVSLCSAMMPALCWKRDNQDMPLSVSTIRDYMSLNNVIKLERDKAVPAEIRTGLKGYLDTLPGFNGDAYDDDGKVKPPDPGAPQYDTTTANQQHGYLAMQFTRSLQSLGDDYGYIFDAQAADVDMMDIVLQRRILIVLIPALEKSNDEIANLGKIVAATLKGMMGATLGSTVEGTSETVIENKPTHSATPFMTVFDEVGYYTAEGMAVMAAQARSLGFCLIFSGQDIPAMKKRVREEANSILANCNIKIFGKLEDPTETKEFFEKTVGTAYVTEVSSFQISGGDEFGSYVDTKQAGIQARARASYEELRTYKEGQAIVTFGEIVAEARIFYSNPGKAKAMRVTRFMPLPPPDDSLIKYAGAITKLRDLMVNKTWTAAKAEVNPETPPEIDAMEEGFKLGEKIKENPVMSGIAGLVAVHALSEKIEPKRTEGITDTSSAAPPKKAAPKPSVAAPTQNATPTTPPPQAETKTDKEEPKPFSMFGPKDGEKAETLPAAAEQSKPETGEPPKADEAPQAPAAPAQPAKPKKLPPEIENIIKNAGLDARKSLFKDGDDIDAGE